MATDSWTPPYIPFRTLMNLVLRMDEEGVPRRIDRSYLTSMAGGMQAAVMGALRALELTGPDGDVLPALTELVQRPDERPELIRQIIIDQYEFAWKLAESNATQGQLEEAFKAQGISGSTLRKAVAFYLRAAKYADMPLSPFFQVPREDGSPPKRTRRSGPSRPRRKAAPPPLVEATGSPATPTGAGTDELRRRYFDMLIQKAETAGDSVDTKLLDRIERLLGMADGQALPETDATE